MSIDKIDTMKIANNKISDRQRIFLDEGFSYFVLWYSILKIRMIPVKYERIKTESDRNCLGA